MLEPTGSVYLDTPRERTVRPNHSSRRRVVSAAVLGFIGIASTMLAGLLAGVHYLVAEPEPILAAIDAAIDSPLARDELHEEISSAVADNLIGSETAEAAGLYGIDVAAESNRVADAILDDPAFRSALDDFIVTIHGLALIDSEGAQVDFTPVTDAALSVLSHESPQLFDLASPERQIIMFDTESIPNLSAPMQFVDRALLVALVGMLGLPLAAAVHPRRHRVVAWIGRTLLVAGTIVGGLTAAVPYIGGMATGWSTAEIALRAAVHRFVVPSVTAVVVGLTLMTIAAVLKKRQNMETSREGADVALGIGQFPGSEPPVGLIGIPDRGLVDAGRTLTNI